MPDVVNGIAELKRFLLPHAVPQPAGWRVAVHHWRGPWPGGDHYDFLALPCRAASLPQAGSHAGGRLLLLVADASGHDAPAAVMAVLARALFHSCPLSSGRERQPFCPFGGAAVRPPEVILAHLNRVLSENSLEGQFMTAFLGALRLADGALRFANAGHPPPRWWRAARRTVEPLPDVGGLPLAIDPGAAYVRGEAVLEPGDVLVCYTDGLIEAEDSPHVPFGLRRLDDALRRWAPDGAEAVKAGLLSDLDRFLKGRPPQDDITTVILERVR